MGFCGTTTFLVPLLVLIISCMKKHVLSQEVKFDQNYVVTYGQDHFSRLGGGTEVQLSLDQASGLFLLCYLRVSICFQLLLISLPQNHPSRYRD